LYVVFHSVKASSPKRAGAGIGLPVCRPCQFIFAQTEAEGLGVLADLAKATIVPPSEAFPAFAGQLNLHQADPDRAQGLLSSSTDSVSLQSAPTHGALFR
jgi:hypothetical protein